MKKLLFLSLLVSVPACGMEEVDQPPELGFRLIGGIYYIGHGNVRKKLEERLGRTFPIDTIFCTVGFVSLCAHHNHFNIITEKEGKKLPYYLPYDDIKQGANGKLISLTIDGSTFPVRCHSNGESFEGGLAHMLFDFTRYANYLLDGMESLKEAGLIPSGPEGDH